MGTCPHPPVRGQREELNSFRTIALWMGPVVPHPLSLPCPRERGLRGKFLWTHGSGTASTPPVAGARDSTWGLGGKASPWCHLVATFWYCNLPTSPSIPQKWVEFILP